MSSFRSLPIAMVLAAFVARLVPRVGTCLRLPVASRSTHDPAVNLARSQRRQTKKIDRHPAHAACRKSSI